MMLLLPIADICDELYELFSSDRGFDRSLFERQMCVMRGQASNLATALKAQMTPLEAWSSIIGIATISSRQSKVACVAILEAHKNTF